MVMIFKRRLRIIWSSWLVSLPLFSPVYDLVVQIHGFVVVLLFCSRLLIKCPYFCGPYCLFLLQQTVKLDFYGPSGYTNNGSKIHKFACSTGHPGPGPEAVCIVEITQERLSTHLLELISCERTTPICLRTTTTRLTDCRFSLFSE
ncbi:hypothetical protein Y032_0071g570 [Ancylostoma ceylanicum]|uniref:Uncharacterized protein n=1 Tax=Ancylostoma ceylanicum TaxID=53326 RepID=A0A016TXD6_9BILA|nr:hypothetical protein Y032_0071g570 [Ancylostoma ceylanicum]